MSELDKKFEDISSQIRRTIGDVHWIIGLQTISCMISR
jgi:hypothetical protein